MADLFKLLQPLQFMETFLKNGARPDGRKFDEFRDALLTCDCVSSANGSALVKLGTASVICGVTTSVVKPAAREPDRGILDLTVRFSNTCATELDNFDRTAIADHVRESLKKVFFHGKLLNLESLCLVPRKFVWRLELEVICLNLNGSIVDLALLAAVAALRQCKLQRYEVDEEFDLITPTKEERPLEVACTPIFTTFVLLNGYLLVDPTQNEEELSESLIRIAVDPDAKSESDSILLFEITGSGDIEDQMLRVCYATAVKRAKFLRDLIHTKSCSENQDNKIQFETMQT